VRISILAVGQRLPAWVNDGFKVYHQRFPQHIKIELIEIPAVQRTSGITAEKAMAQESERMLKHVQPGQYVIALDEHGKQWTSRELAAGMEEWQQLHPQVAILIGGADGLGSECKARADKTWSLSRLTLPHGMVRVMLAEQLYRGWTLIQGHPYHRD